jgi:rubrerythrin
MANLTFLFFASHFSLIISHRRWNDSCSPIIYMILEVVPFFINTTEGNAMKGLLSVVRFSLVVVLIVPLLISFNGCSKKEEPKEQAKVEQKRMGKATATNENLKLGYSSELKHASWYETFAKQAQKEHKVEVAAMFRALSQSEKLHADNLENLLKARGVEPVAPIVEAPHAGTTKQYLKSAASSEGVETESMYPAFIQKAKDEQDSVATELFTQTLKADERHGRLVKKAMDSETGISTLPYMMCPKCGYIKGSDKDTECRVCKAKIETFKKL